MKKRRRRKQKTRPAIEYIPLILLVLVLANGHFIVGELHERGILASGNSLTGFSVFSTQAVASLDSVILNASLSSNTTDTNLTAHPINVSDADNDSVKNITNWFVNGSSIAVLNMPFEGGSTSGSPGNNGTTKDYSGFSNNGTVVNATFNATGGYDGSGAYEFDGVDDRIRIAHDNSFGIIKSVVFRFKPAETFDGVGANRTEDLFFKRQGVIPFTGWMVEVEELSGSSGAHIFLTNDAGAGPANFTNSLPFNFSAGTWYHVAFVLNDTNTSKVYINGVEFTNNTDPATSLAAFNTDIKIGKGEGISGETPFNGSIDDILFYNRTLSPEQVVALFNNRSDLIVSQETAFGDIWQACVTPNDGSSDGSEVCSNNLTVLGPNTAPTINEVLINTTFGTNLSTENITAYPLDLNDIDGDSIINITNWFVDNDSITLLNMPFENHSGNESSVAKDYSSLPNNGSVFEAIVSPGIRGDAYQFDGVDDQIVVAHNAAFNFANASGQFTLEAWINSSPIIGDDHHIISKHDNTFTNGWVFEVDFDNAPAGRLHFIGRPGGSTVALSSQTIDDNSWHHVVAVVDRVGSTIQLYVDGNLSNTTTITTGVSWDTTDPLLIGNENGANQSFNGTMDEVRIYNRSLSSGQIRLLYNNGSPNHNIISTNETQGNETWRACVTPNDEEVDGLEVCSNNLTISSNVTAPDTTPPAPINGLVMTSRTTTSITWDWNNPVDVDFDHVDIYLNGDLKQSAAVTTYTASGLIPNTEYTIGVESVDTSGNVNTNRQESLAKTLSGGGSSGGGGGGGGPAPGIGPDAEPGVEAEPAVDVEAEPIEPEVGEDLSVDQVEQIAAALDVTPAQVESVLPAAPDLTSVQSLGLTISNDGDKTIKNLEINVEDAAPSAVPLYTTKVLPLGEEVGAGVVASPLPVDGDLLKSQLLSEQVIDQLNPGESVDVNVDVQVGLSLGASRTLSVTYTSFGEEVGSQDVTIQTTPTIFGSAVDVHEDRDEFDLYVVLSGYESKQQAALGTLTGAVIGAPVGTEEFLVDFAVNREPKVGYRPSLSLFGLWESLWRGPTTAFTDQFGPYSLDENNSVIFAQKFAYNESLVQGKFDVDVNILRDGESVARSVNEVELGK